MNKQNENSFNFLYTKLLISLLQSPTLRHDGGNTVDSANSEKYAEEARSFIERRLLQREVQITVEDFTNTALVGSVRHPRGDVAQLLLSQGFARCADKYMTSVAGGHSRLRTAEGNAKANKLKIWETYEPVQNLVSFDWWTFH